MHEPLRIGIVGPGKVAAVHAAAIARIPDARLTGVAGRDLDRTRAWAAEHGATPFVGLTPLLESGTIDLLLVCTPHPRHCDAAIEAASAGVHVAVEKPMALTVEDCDAMINAARGHGVVLSVISQRRWYPASRRVKEAIESGRIGQPVLATVEVLGWRGPEYYAMDPWRGTRDGEGGGVLVNQAVHQLDLLAWFMGPIAGVDGLTANLNHPDIEVEDTALAIVRFESGAIGSIVATNSVRPGLYARVLVHGRNGASVGVETDRGSIFVAGVTPPSLARNDVWTIPGEEALPERWAEEDRVAVAGVDLGSYYHELQLRDVIEAIRAGRDPAVSGEDGRRAVALMAGVYDAAAQVPA